MGRHSYKNKAGGVNTQKEDFAMVEHKIVPNRDGYSVRIYDAPAGGIRILFRQKEVQNMKMQSQACGFMTALIRRFCSMRSLRSISKLHARESPLVIAAYHHWFVSANRITALTRSPSFRRSTSCGLI
jgi:hypothetical protein